MKRHVTTWLLLVALVAPLLPAGRAVADLSDCDAVTLKNRPSLGQSGDWDYEPYQERHNRFLRTHPKVFASGYLSGRHFYVGFTRAVCKHLREFRQGLPQKWRVRAFKANYSYRRLRRTQRCVSDLMGNERLGISAVGSDVYRNKVHVMLERNTERRRNVIKRRCGATTPPILYFTEGTVVPE